jgi:hypothetical protein
MTGAENVVSDEPVAANDAELNSGYSQVIGGKGSNKGRSKGRSKGKKNSGKKSQKKFKKVLGKKKKSVKKGSKKRGPSKWITHVKAYCKKHNMTFPEALKDPNCGKAFIR